MAQILGMLLLGFAFSARLQGALSWRRAVALSGPGGNVVVANDRYGEAAVAFTCAIFGVLVILFDVCLFAFGVDMDNVWAVCVAVANLVAALGLGLTLVFSLFAHYRTDANAI